MATTAERGADAEALAARFLARRGVRIVDRNYRWRGGEIDLIALEGRTLLFVEVRLRTHHAYGGASASIDARKRARIIQTAQHYLHGHAADGAGGALPPCRFDAILLSHAGEADIEWIKDAFSS